MSRIFAASALALSLAAGLTGAAQAQSYNAPAGIPAATAPGGLAVATGSDLVRQRAERAVRPSPTLFEGVETTGSLHRVRSTR